MGDTRLTRFIQRFIQSSVSPVKMLDKRLKIDDNLKDLAHQAQRGLKNIPRQRFAELPLLLSRKGSPPVIKGVTNSIPAAAIFTHHQIDRNQEARFIQPFADVMALSECQATSYWRSGTWSYTWVQSVDVKAEVDWLRSVSINPVQRHFYYLPNTISIYFVHGEGGDVMFPDARLLPRINVPKANVRQIRRRQVDDVKPRKRDWLTACRFARQVTK
jgi:hypothetical protein